MEQECKAASQVASLRRQSQRAMSMNAGRETLRLMGGPITMWAAFVERAVLGEGFDQAGRGDNTIAVYPHLLSGEHRAHECDQGTLVHSLQWKRATWVGSSSK